MAQTIDARGLSCPQPVILTRKAIQQSGGGELTVWVDTMTQVHNCTRAAQKLGCDVAYEEKDDAFELRIRK
jgi:TusA-related sulfurtransferase